ncbi:MAG: IclR family transcriptional regulator [Zoogloea oleivorans]|jgi:DNA-binding IclR family transcriptional regulator|uniref:IclR family transcriptional regulator n=1 Tax=Zoogloea oleivorans TaxID=1552750 RepID=UPI002A372130|nr:IclR family transcriptional regulator [Zoogloea oleivorans]MDY0035422.1 IclR family transcriptional regulator [Zoogloea oleivorans]
MAGKYTNDAQQRLLKIVLAMFGDVVNGYLPSELQKTVGCSAGTMTRDLDNLDTAGLARQDAETGRWTLTPRLPQQTIKVWSAIDRAEQRVQEAKQRFTRNPD